MEKKTQIEKYISVMRIYSTIAIVLSHTVSTIVSNFTITSGQETFFVAVKHSVIWAVLLFIMMSGALLLNSKKELTPSVCIKKYVLRMVLALFVFGVPFSMLEIFFKTKEISVNMVFEAICNVVTGSSWKHLWYIYMLIGIYFILPILSTFVKNSTREIQRYVLIVLFVVNFIFPMINIMFDIEIAFELPIVSFGVFFFLAGKYISDSEKSYKIGKKLICAFALIGLIIFMTIFGLEKYLEYNSPITAVLTILCFDIFRNCRWENIKNEKALWELDRVCFGVYLIHPVFIHFVYKFLDVTPADFTIYPIMTVLFAIVFTIVSFVASYVMRKIPVLSKYIL